MRAVARHLRKNIAPGLRTCWLEDTSRSACRHFHERFSLRFAGNVIWFVPGGGVAALIRLIGAAVFAVPPIGLPLARAGVERAELSAWPFGRETVHARELDGKGGTAATAATGTIGFLVNPLRACAFGLAPLLVPLVAGAPTCLTLTCPLTS